MKITIYGENKVFFIMNGEEKITSFNIYNIYRSNYKLIRKIYYIFFSILVVTIGFYIIKDDMSIGSGVIIFLLIWPIMLVIYYIFLKMNSLIHIEYIIDEDMRQQYIDFLNKFSITTEKVDYGHSNFLKYLSAIFKFFDTDPVLVKVSGNICEIGMIDNLHEKGFYSENLDMYPFIKFLPHAIFLGFYEISYKDLKIFIQNRYYEVDSVNENYDVIEQTWKYTTKSGKRDRRRKNNPTIYRVKAISFFIYEQDEHIWTFDVLYLTYANDLINTFGKYLQYIRNKDKYEDMDTYTLEKLKAIKKQVITHNKIPLKEFIRVLQMIFYYVITLDGKIEISEISYVKRLFDYFEIGEEIEWINVDFSDEKVLKILKELFEEIYQSDPLLTIQTIELVEKTSLYLIAIDNDTSEVEVKKLTALMDILHSIIVEEKSNENTQNKISQYIQELNNMIGLENVKLEVQNLINMVKVNSIRKEAGLPTINSTSHMVFMGNPGTGKTTVARLLSKIYASLGVLSKGHLVEVDRQNLVAEYVGQTATKTKEIIKSAVGGVLFIDEAYSLTNKGNSDYGHEAIEILLKMMEDYRDNLIVIVAGYEYEMKDFLESNPGLKSRFKKVLYFKDFTLDELIEIFMVFCKKYHYKLDEKATKELPELIKKVYTKNEENFANARTIRNLFEKVIQQQANRITTLHNVSKEDLKIIKYEDLKSVVLFS
jgi:SpoVK/Ycf46/Vps4 family AAA+-type ATPase